MNSNTNNDMLNYNHSHDYNSTGMYASYNKSDCNAQNDLMDSYNCMQNKIAGRNISVVSQHMRCFQDRGLEHKMWTDTYKDDIVLPKECARHKAKLNQQSSTPTQWEVDEQYGTNVANKQSLMFNNSKYKVGTRPECHKQDVCGKCSNATNKYKDTSGAYYTSL